MERVARNKAATSGIGWQGMTEQSRLEPNRCSIVQWAGVLGV